MNRILTTIIALWSMCTMAGLPPTTLSGEQSATKPTTFTFEAPNYQGTQTSGIKSRVETGNTNLLVNPSFEHSTVTTGWTITNATATADTTNQVEGKKALSLALTGALSVVQDSTINAANLVGLQGVARIKIKTSDVDGLQVCARNAGVTSTSLCINIPKDGMWKEINIPYILTATSNGIAITSTGTTGTVKLDDAFVGTSAPFQGVSGARLIGAVVISGCSGAWSTSSTSFASFSTLTGCTYTTSGQAQAPSTNIPAIKFASLPAGDYRLEYEGGLGLNAASTSTTAYFQFTDGTNTAREISNYYAYNSQPISSTMSQTITYNSSQSNVTLEIKGKISGTVASAITGTTSQPGTIKVWYFPPESKIYSDFNSGFAENAGEIFATAQTSCPVGTLPADGSAVSRTTYAELFKNIGTTYGVGDGSTTFNLPNAKGVFIRGAGSQTISSITYTGTQGTTQGDQMQGHIHNTQYAINGASGTSPYANVGSARDTPTSTSATTAAISDGTNGTPRVGSETRPANISALYCIRAYNKNIVGSFAGIEKCANDYECTDTFSAQISSTGVVSNENIDWINGNCTNPSTGNYTCTYNTILKDGTIALSSPMSCNVTPTAASSRTPFGYVNINSTTSVSPQIVDDNGNTTNSGFFISCQKGTNDYKPKTAKVALPFGEVSASYYCSSNTALTSGAQVNLDTKEWDTHNAVTTGASWKFTAPMEGTYQINAFFGTVTSSNAYLYIYKNGVILKPLVRTLSGSNMFGTTTVKLSKNDYMDIRSDTSSISANGGTLTGATQVVITRIGSY